MICHISATNNVRIIACRFLSSFCWESRRLPIDIATHPCSSDKHTPIPNAHTCKPAPTPAAPPRPSPHPIGSPLWVINSRSPQAPQPTLEEGSMTPISLLSVPPSHPMTQCYWSRGRGWEARRLLEDCRGGDARGRGESAGVF